MNYLQFNDKGRFEKECNMSLKEYEEILYKQRLEFIGDKNNAEKMEELKKNYTFHSLKFEDGMDRWFDLWRRKK